MRVSRQTSPSCMRSPPAIHLVARTGHQRAGPVVEQPRSDRQGDGQRCRCAICQHSGVGAARKVITAPIPLPEPVPTLDPTPQLEPLTDLDVDVRELTKPVHAVTAAWWRRTTSTAVVVAVLVVPAVAIGVSARHSASPTSLPGGSTLPFTGLGTPYGVAIDGMGTVYVTDLDNNRVLSLAAESSSQSTLSVHRTRLADRCRGGRRWHHNTSPTRQATEWCR